MPDADDIAGADEEMRLAEGDAAIDQLRCAGDDEQGIAILFDFRPLMRVFCVFDRQIMQMELRLHPKQQVAVRLEQADSDDMAGLCRPYAGLFDRNVGDALAGGIDAARNNAGCRLRGRGQVSNLLHRKTSETATDKTAAPGIA